MRRWQIPFRVLWGIPGGNFMERKYKHKGYSDRDRDEKKRDRPSAEPRPRQEQMGPRTPRMVGTVMRARCSNCATILAPGFDQNGQCPKCHLDMHSCKQCVHFDTGAVRMHATHSGTHSSQ